MCALPSLSSLIPPDPAYPSDNVQAPIPTRQATLWSDAEGSYTVWGARLVKILLIFGSFAVAGSAIVCTSVFSQVLSTALLTLPFLPSTLAPLCLRCIHLNSLIFYNCPPALVALFISSAVISLLCLLILSKDLHDTSGYLETMQGHLERNELSATVQVFEQIIKSLPWKAEAMTSALIEKYVLRNNRHALRAALELEYISRTHNAPQIVMRNQRLETLAGKFESLEQTEKKQFQEQQKGDLALVCRLPSPLLEIILAYLEEVTDSVAPLIRFMTQLDNYWTYKLNDKIQEQRNLALQQPPAAYYSPENPDNMNKGMSYPQLHSLSNQPSHVLRAALLLLWEKTKQEQKRAKQEQKRARLEQEIAEKEQLLARLRQECALEQQAAQFEEDATQEMS